MSVIYMEVTNLKPNLKTKLTTVALLCAMSFPLLADEMSEQIDAHNQQRQQQQDKQREQALSNETDVKFDTSSQALVLPKDESPCYPIFKMSVNDYDSPKAISQFQSLFEETIKELHLTFPHCLGGQGLGVVMKSLQNKIIEKGYVTTKVVVPEQDLRSGEVKLSVIKGKVRHILVEDRTEAGAKFTPLTAWTAMALSSGDLLNVRDIEQSLENLKRVPTADANIEIIPAEGGDVQVGESDLKVSYAQAFPFRLTLGLDDSGSTSTGKFQGSATLSLDNLFTANDLFYTSFTHSIHTHNDDAGDRDTHNLSFHYSVPFGYWNMSFDHSENKYHQTVFGAFENYVYSGKSKTNKANLSYVAYRDNYRKTTLWGGLWTRSSNSYVDDEEIGVQHRRTGGWQAGIRHKEYIGDSVLNADLSYKRGTGAFGAKHAPEELFGEGTSRFEAIFTTVSLLVPFKVAEQPFQYNFTFNGQWNHTPLTSPDRFSIGGRYTVRGFDGELTLSGDSGFTVQNELAWNFADDKQLYLGVDYGKVFRQPEDSLGNELIGSALGLRGQLWGINYDLFVGMPLKKPDGFRTSHQVAGFNLSYQF